MPRLFELGTLVTRAKVMADMENDDHVTDPTWKVFVSRMNADLHQIICNSGYRYFETTESLVTTGTAFLPEPDAIHSVVGVDRVRPDGTRYALRELMAQERNMFGPGLVSEACGYAFIDDQIQLFGKPPTGQTYEVLFIPQPLDLELFANDQGVDTVTPDGEAFIVHGAAAMALAREESDYTFHLGQSEAARGRVEKWASLRSMHAPKRLMTDEDEYGFYDAADWRSSGR